MNQNSSFKSVPRRLAEGTESVAFDVDRAFRDRLCRLVDNEMHQLFKRRQDPEDVVQSVLRTFFKRAAKGNYFFEDQNAIWALLKQVARNKLKNRVIRDKAQKRDVFRELHDEDEILGSLEPVDVAQSHVLGEALERALGRAESPASEVFQLQLFGYPVSDIVDIVLEELEPPFPLILQLRLQGNSELEIGSIVGCGREAVRYRLKRIQERMRHLLDQQNSSL